MRLAIDARYDGARFPGIGRHLETLLRHLPAALEPGDEQLTLAGSSACAAPRSLAEQLRLPGEVAALRPEVLLAPYVFTAVRCPCPRAVLVYDTVPLHPRHGLPSRWRRALAGAWLRAVVRRSAVVLTLSEASRGELARLFPERSGDLLVTGSAAHPAFVPRSLDERQRARRQVGLGPSYVLHVGAERPHKNVGTLLRAFAEAGLPALGVELALVGSQHGPRLGDPPWLRRLGPVTDELLPALLSGALALAVPSLDEGFGLPALEAMACGAPVVAARRGALPEVLGEAGLMFEALDQAELAACLARLARQPELRRALAQRGSARAARFDGRDVARRTLAACRRAAARPAATERRRAA